MKRPLFTGPPQVWRPGPGNGTLVNLEQDGLLRRGLALCDGV
jgi:hypothetical protein